ncbi:family 16 glycoside hydrolase [Anditalea andensis]|uniref:3-keto-alpha-glucoside-1,2-lyase/3-keto-2-hydroxy-glucal hydratase domain-containing protein n=1 Tax=Anditalea andensis TaxID=1048983 RepID=A0A074KVS9_9BACT|nr:family 16 glycoside hydrolase [Anditalea andensis]KEO71693.1 hypothetical protein EL17_23340 [Anditalea andensis]
MKMFNKITLIFILLSLNLTAYAQRTGDQRTLSTKIVDLLAVLPSQDQKHLEENMEEISGLGIEGLIELAGMMSSPGSGDNTKIEYALAGYSFYVSDDSRDALRADAVKAYGMALENAKYPEVKTFILNQLRMVGKEDGIASISRYLNDERHCDAAARVLAGIPASESGEALRLALEGSGSVCKASVLAALGSIRYKKALEDITAYASDPSLHLRKPALSALANIADASSSRLLKEAAARSSYTYTEDNATGAYLFYIQRLNETGDSDRAAKLARDLLKIAGQKGQVHTQSAALHLLADIHGPKSMKTLVAAAGEGDPTLRAAALDAAVPYIDPSNLSLWTGRLKRMEPAAQAAIMAMFGKVGIIESMPALREGMSHPDINVRLAAIGAAGKIGHVEMLPAFIEMMKTADSLEIRAVSNAVLVMKGEGISDQVADALSEMEPAVQAAFIAILGAKAASHRFDDVFFYIHSDDIKVRQAAVSTLPKITEANHLPRLYELLNNMEDSPEIQYVQQAIITGLVRGDQENISKVIQTQMAGISEDKRIRYFNILSSMGGPAGILTIEEAYRKGNTATQLAALEALSSWSDFSAADGLFKIASASQLEGHREMALKGYVRAVSLSEFPSDQKVLLLKKAMNLANTSEVKRTILAEIDKNRTFPALIFAGKYLDDPDVMQEAAQAVMNISLSDMQFHGPIVRQLLQKTINTLKGPDSEYQIASIKKHLSEMPSEGGFVALFNDTDLSGWKGVVADPLVRNKMSPQALAKAQAKADQKIPEAWKVENEEMTFLGKGDNIATAGAYGDFELFVDWKIVNDGQKEGDGGIYLRGTPKVQIWDISGEDVGAQVGSGGLYHNSIHKSTPLKVADNPVGEWNNFRILMKGDRVTVYLNGELVTDNVIMENYWDRTRPIFTRDQIELQAHGSKVAYRDIFIRELPSPAPFELDPAETEDGFEVLFDGTNMYQWQGNTTDYVIENGEMVVHKPKFGSGGNLFTKEEYSDFVFRFEFKLTPGANNGLGIRAPLEGDAAYQGMEIQILDNDADIYRNLKEHQYHGSVYGIIPAKRGHLKPVGEWNYQEVTVKGPNIKVILNGTTILEGNVEEASREGTLDGRDHPGLKRKKGYIGFLGHGSTVWFRNIRVKKLE